MTNQINPKEKTIYFVMPALGGGGAERVISILLNNLNRKKFKLHLVIIKKDASTSFLKDLKPDVTIHYLNIKTSLKYSAPIFILKLTRLLYKNKPDILFMGAGTINAFTAFFLPIFPKNMISVARESNLPSKFEKIKFIKKLYKKVYGNFDEIIVQSNDMQEDLLVNFNLPKEKLIKINNPCDIQSINKNLSISSPNLFDPNKINLLAAGRLTYQKGFDLLLKELKNANIRENLHLTILGEGEDELMLKKMVKNLSLEDKVTFAGQVNNPFQYMQQADLFVLSSRYEGFPNILLESLYCGSPALVNKCQGGVDEIIKEGFNGLFFSFDKSNFAQQLNRILTLHFNKKEISADIAQRFGVETIIPQYENLLLKRNLN